MQLSSSPPTRRSDSGGRQTKPKLVAELEGKPIVRHVAEAALASRAHPVLLVRGHAHEQVASALDGLMLERIHNREPGAGLSASLKLAVRALPSTARGAVILLGDMPRIVPSLIDRLIDALMRRRSSRSRSCRCATGGAAIRR
ncbi:MAG: NTP transferase domain-containing protein [Methylocella sp.]